MKVATNSASWLYYILLVLGRKRQNCSLKTITCEARPLLKRYVNNLWQPDINTVSHLWQHTQDDHLISTSLNKVSLPNVCWYDVT